MRKPDLNGGRVAQMLYSTDTESKISTPPEKSNIFGPPSLTPGIKYPISEREEHIRELAYNQGYSDSMRMNRAGRLVEDDPFLDVLRKRVEEIRREKIKKGLIEPVNRQERKWRLGL